MQKLPKSKSPGLYFTNNGVLSQIQEGFLKHNNVVNYLNARHPAWEVGRCVSVGDVGDQLETQLTSVKDPLQGAIFFPDC